ncbi:hypothetical protein [Natrinema gelatinilyticum]|uniref:hypothetical protein n=1 Tax=Natrinema gelatinilyticum TaxID=2961571 RepID=UPI0020C3E376|nr:hypothetical protein [Natrinema gelatinilyticum]
MVRIRNPEPVPPEETKLLVVWFNLSELLETDPVIDQGHVDGRSRLSGMDV